MTGTHGVSAAQHVRSSADRLVNSHRGVQAGIHTLLPYHSRQLHDTSNRYWRFPQSSFHIPCATGPLRWLSVQVHLYMHADVRMCAMCTWQRGVIRCAYGCGAHMRRAPSSADSAV